MGTGDAFGQPGTGVGPDSSGDINIFRRTTDPGLPVYQPPLLPPPPVTPTSVGITPQAFSQLLYGKSIPLWVGGKSLIGCSLIEGPFFNQIGSDMTVSGIAAACIPANFANDTRSITQLRLSGKEAWNGTANSSGVSGTPVMSGLNVGGATTGTEQRIRFLFGTNTQAPDASSVALYGADAQAYNPLVCVVFENILTAPFGNVVPFFSILLEDNHFGDPADGISWNDAIGALAAFDGRGSKFQALDLTGRIDALILGSQTTFTDFIASMRTAKPHWSIRTADKLYLIEKGPFARDLLVDRSKIAENQDKPIVFSRGDATEAPRQLVYSFIDSNRDYEPSTVQAAEDIDATQSFNTTTVNVPEVTTAVEALSEANFAFYWRETARQTSQYIGLLPYTGIEPGDVHQIDTDARTYFQSATEVARNPDWTVDVKAEGFLTCGIAGTGATADYIFYLFDDSCHLFTTLDAGGSWVETATPPATMSVDTWEDMVMAVNDGDYSTMAMFDVDVAASLNPSLFDSHQGGVLVAPGYADSASSPMYAFSPFAAGSADHERASTGAITANAVKILVAIDATHIGGTDSVPTYARLSTDSGATWADVTSLGTGLWLAACFSQSASLMYIQKQGGYVYKSADGGASWSALTAGSTTAVGRGNARLRCNPSGATVARATSDGLFTISHNSGAAWTTTNFATLGGFAVNRCDFGMSSDGQTIIVVANGDAGTNKTHAWTSTDGGATWTDRTGSLQQSATTNGVFVTNVSPDGRAMMVAYDYGSSTGCVDISLDGGSTWAARTFSMSEMGSLPGGFTSAYVVPAA